MRALRLQIIWCSKAQWVLLIATVAMAASFFAFGYRPQNNKLTALNTEIAKRRQEINEHRSRTNVLPEITRKVEILQNKLNLIKELPKHEEFPSFMGDVTRFIRVASLEPPNTVPSLVPKRFDQYCERSIALSFDGDFLGVGSFLQNVEQLKRLIRVKSLNIRLKDGKIGPGRVQVQMALNIYWEE